MAADNTIREVSFQIDAGLIDRLGRELVGKAETAISELIKNAYDADATDVNLNFIDTSSHGGSLEIDDNGSGMTFEQLVRGFMTISSSDKIHNPTSDIFKRKRAGRKGIGRFATQRLGRKLTITTQTADTNHALRLTIDWTKYVIDTDLTSIKNTVEKIDKCKVKGTTLLIEDLRDFWVPRSIEVIYRHVSDLLQPDYLSDRSSGLKLATQKDESFSVNFYITQDRIKSVVASPRKMVFDKALATIEGYVDQLGEGFYGVQSESLSLNDYAISVNATKSNVRYNVLSNIHFKAYYFIYNRPEYYAGISKLELKNIQSLAAKSGGIRLYRNGFRVLPYGDSTDDWLGLDVRYSGEEGTTNIPFANKNLFGFVEVIDANGQLFEETASREGLIENEALVELKDFVSKSLVSARQRIAEKITLVRKQQKDLKRPTQHTLASSNDNFLTLEAYIEKGQDNGEAKQALRQIQSHVRELLEEVGMIRVLAGLGLTIAEFTHEIIQFTPSINGYLFSLEQIQNTPDGLNLVEKLKRSFNHFTSYTSYFNSTVSQNVSRELKPILIIDSVNSFLDVIKEDASKQKIEIAHDFYGYDLYTIPMHPSEWSSILFNFYTNSKKAIARAGAKGKILIICGSDKDSIVYLEFMDNGDGIPSENKDRIFNAFFTTSTPAGLDAEKEEKLTGTGLGLKIVKDIIDTYGGRIFLTSPENGYSTSFRVELPKASEKQLKDYAY